jgi:molecular chaperone DnaK
VPQVEVTFDIDANGIVHVSAKDLGTGKEQKIRIESSSGLSEEEIKKMVKEGELHADEDRKVKEKAEARNEADSFIYTTEKALKDYGDKVTDEDKQKINAAIADLRKALEADDVAEIKAKMETLKQVSYKLAEEVYKTSSAQNPGQEGASTDSSGDTSQDTNTGNTSNTDNTGKSNDNVEDVDYEVVDDDEDK